MREHCLDPRLLDLAWRFDAHVDDLGTLGDDRKPFRTKAHSVRSSVEDAGLESARKSSCSRERVCTERRIEQAGMVKYTARTGRPA